MMISPRSARLFLAVAALTAAGACEKTTAPVAAGRSADNHFIDLPTGTALVRHSPTVNGEAWVTGSIQMMLPENTTLNGEARIWGDLLVPGTPSLKTTGRSDYDQIQDGAGSASPSNYKITLTGNARIDDLVRRTDAVAIAPVAPPPAPTGTRNLTLNRSSDTPGSWGTVRNITLNQDFGSIVVPGGTYGNLTLNKGSAIRLGVAGSAQPTVYNFQKVTLNNGARVEIVGPAIVTVGTVASINNDVFVGNLFHPEWLDFRVASGNLTLNNDSYFLGYVRVPSGSVSLNHDARLIGGTESDKLSLDGESRLILLQRQPPALPAPDVSVSRFERVDGTARTPAPAFGALTVGVPTTFEATISSPTGTATTTVACSATLSGLDATQYQLTWITQSVNLQAGTSGVCAFTLTANAAASSVAVTVTAASPSDPVSANNSATGNLVVTPAVDPALTADLVVRAITPLADIVAGTPVNYSAAIGLLGGTQASVDFNCLVSAKRVRDNAPITVTMLPGTGTATSTTDGTCAFSLGALSANGSTAEDYEISVHVDPANANEISAANNTKVGTQRVTPKMVDVYVGSIQRVSGTTMLPVDSVPAGITGHYVASIGVVAGSTDVTCVVNVRPRVNRLGATIVTGMAGTVTAPATADHPAECSFDVNLSGNGDFDDLYDIEVTANPVGAVEIGGQPNTLSVEQLAIVRVDISLDAITMTVDGVAADPTTIAKGKTGVYHAIIHNNSARPAQMRCDVTVNGAPLTLPASLTAFTLAGGATTDCTFSIAYGSALVVSNITVVATATSPLDADVSNNERVVITTPVGDGHFVGVENATFVANETRQLDALGNYFLTSAAQNMQVTNLALFVTDSRTPIGYFKLVGSASSNGVEFSRDSVGGPLDTTDPQLALNPGVAGIPSCIRANRTNPLFKNNHAVTLEICASPAAGEPTKQQITVSYTSAKSGVISAAMNPVFFGPTVTIDVTLSWALAGAPVGITDRAQARVEIDLFDLVQGSSIKKLPTGCFRVYSGTDVVKGGPSTCP